MVHSTYAQGHVMGGREIHSPLGIPKSPSFHSGLDLVAASTGVEDSVKKAFDQHETTGFPGKISFYSGSNAPPNTLRGTVAPTAVGTPTGAPIANFEELAVSFGSSVNESHGLSSSCFYGNISTMINGKTNVDGIGAGAGAMKNGIGLSAQALALQKNSTAVRSMQAMGPLPVLKGIM